jgi:hypothetical protein
MNPMSDPLFIRADMARRMEEAESHRRAGAVRRPGRRWRLRFAIPRVLIRKQRPAREGAA